MTEEEINQIKAISEFSFRPKTLMGWHGKITVTIHEKGLITITKRTLIPVDKRELIKTGEIIVTKLGFDLHEEVISLKASTLNAIHENVATALMKSNIPTDSIL